MKKRILSGIGVCMVLLCSLLFSVSAAAAGSASSPYVNWNCDVVTSDSVYSVVLSHSGSSDGESYTFDSNGLTGWVSSQAFDYEEDGYGSFVTREYDLTAPGEISELVFTASDFYSWCFPDCEGGESSNMLFSYFHLDGLGIEAVYEYEYSLLGSSEIVSGSLVVPAGEYPYDDIAAAVFLYENMPEPVRFHSFKITFRNLNASSVSFYSRVSTIEQSDRVDLRSKDVVTDEPSKLGFADYTSWIATAVGGFLDFELFPGFTFGGILMVFIAFSCVMWFLRLVGGG